MEMTITADMVRKTIEYNRENGRDYDPHPLRVKIPHAKESLKVILSQILHHEVKWLPEYDEIADWLTDNKGKGLVLLGPPGVGKTEIAMKAIPILFHCVLGKIMSTYQSIEICCENTYKCIMQNKLIVIDDFGIEGLYNDYGNPHVVFSEVVDRMERAGILLIATTNLTLDDIRKKYGLRTIDRFRGNVRLVVFKEDSLRGKYRKVYD